MNLYHVILLRCGVIDSIHTFANVTDQDANGEDAAREKFIDILEEIKWNEHYADDDDIPDPEELFDAGGWDSGNYSLMVIQSQIENLQE